MTRMPNITMCKKDDPLLDVAEKLIERQIDAIPVVKEKGAGFEVIGRITKTNVTEALVSIGREDG